MPRKLPLKFPVKFDLESVLSRYEKVINQNEVVLLDTSILGIPLFFEYESPRIKSHTYLCSLAQKTDANPKLYHIKNFFQYNLLFLYHFINLLEKNKKKIYLTSNLKNEIGNTLRFFYNMENFAKDKKLFDDKLGMCQKTVVSFYKQSADMIKDLINYLKIARVDNEHSLDVDGSLVSAVFRLLNRRKTKGVILSSDKKLRGYLNLAKSMKKFIKPRYIYLVGYRYDPVLRSGELSVLWSYDKTNEMRSVDEVFG